MPTAKQRLALCPASKERGGELALADREELDHMRDQVDVLEQRLAEAEALRARSEQVVDELKASFSWRVTAPLRRLKGGSSRA